MKRRILKRVSWFGAVLSALAASAVPVRAEWQPRFAGLEPDGMVAALTVWDDGTGPTLYAGGLFFRAGGTIVNKIAKLDGDHWTPLGIGMGLSGGFVWIMTEFDDGTGPALYVGGDFLEAGGITVNRIAKWDGTGWSALGSGMNATVRGALTVFDDGTGPALYAGGDFWIAGGRPASRIAKWDGQSWSAVGGGTGGSNNSVRCLLVHDDGSGPALYVGGKFDSAGGVPVNGVARWNGQVWSDVGGGVDGLPGRLGPVRGMVEYDDGTGPALYATGQFTEAGGVPASGIAKWDGTAWSALGSGLEMDPPIGMTGRRVAVVETPSGPRLFAAGQFITAGGESANYVASWDGKNWSPLGSGLDDVTYAVTSYDEGDGPAVIVGGVFSTAGGSASANLAKWVPPVDVPFETDGDGDVNMDDLADFADCMTGPGGDSTKPCLKFHDVDSDADVDLTDFAGFQRAYTGAGQSDNVDFSPEF